MSDMMDLYVKGGALMPFLLACSIIMLAVVVERYLVLRSATIDTTLLRQEITNLLESDDVDGALRLCESTPGPISAVLTAGLRKYHRLKALGKSQEAVEAGVLKAMEDFSLHVIHALEKNLVALQVVGNVAPLLGMTGTVTGMIAAFNAMISSGASSGAVALGISEALITTAVGLLIAIPAVIAYNYYTGMVNKFVLDIEQSATELVDFITMRKQYSPSDATA